MALRRRPPVCYKIRFTPLGTPIIRPEFILICQLMRWRQDASFPLIPYFTSLTEKDFLFLFVMPRNSAIKNNSNNNLQISPSHGKNLLVPYCHQIPFSRSYSSEESMFLSIIYFKLKFLLFCRS